MSAITDPGIPTPEIPLSEARSFEGYVSAMPIEPQTPPIAARGAIGWVRANLVNSVGNAVLTVVFGALSLYVIWGFLKFALIDATWTGSNRDACLAKPGQAAGACWPMIHERLAYFVYGSYPLDQRWRVDIVFVLGAIGLVWALWLNAPRRDLAALYFFVLFPIAAFCLLCGFAPIGLPVVDTDLWGGILVTLVISSAGIVAALPLGIVLALGRRSKLPIISLASTVFIEVARGVPLITVLFVAKVMLGYFIPEWLDPALMVKALIAVALFSAAYMAEVVRGGLQAIPKGQQEGASSLGLGYWQSMRLIILPQALRLTIPGIVNTFIGGFKDTSLVLIIGMFDFLGTINIATADAKWATPVSASTGYLFAAIFYWICCFGMSRYSRAVEMRLNVAHKR
ncbi:general L-amino acid transport system permease protein [Rhizobiales bacterium GAS191]|nr:general L-amino acid transport system permease protein [Rhizobiales bacterium GAS113]SEE19863.1 general L-amino acid transport system permease protein [Rhizobiales bacterium GAS191]SEE35941.1 general L-amino acid transport system permease protein [Rhizobiales bacterium GAS188]